MKALTKILASNDVGTTGSHQAGIHIPKQKEFLEFFPSLDKKIYNPDALINFYDCDQTIWEFRFVYYNNLFFGKTRNEYRLSRISRFLKKFDAKESDGLTLIRDANDKYLISIVPYEKLKESRTDDQDPIQTDVLINEETIDLVFDEEWNLTIL